MPKWVSVLAVAGLTLSSACASFEAKLREAPSQPCGKLVDEYPKMVADPEYAKQTEQIRAQYETAVAHCYLDHRQPERALALASRWDGPEGWKVQSRAHAQLDQPAECRAALERLANSSEIAWQYFVESGEFRIYAREEWFISIVVQKWLRTRTTPLEEVAAKLARVRGEALLSLRVAAADVERPVGEWGVWLGVVRSSRIDRANRETVLELEGVDVQNRLADRRTTSIEVSESTVTPRYEDVHEEVFVPNGVGFVVRYPDIEESLVTMESVMVFGQYVGRDEDQGWPVMLATIVVPRRPESRSTTDTNNAR
jgi:hypothetical protein